MPESETVVSKLLMCSLKQMLERPQTGGGGGDLGNVRVSFVVKNKNRRQSLLQWKLCAENIAAAESYKYIPSAEIAYIKIACQPNPHPTCIFSKLPQSCQVATSS